MSETTRYTQLKLRNLRDLVWIRTIAVLGQLVVIALAVLVFEIPLPVWALLAVTSAEALWTAASAWWQRHRPPLGDRAFFAHLVPDVLALSAVFYLSGGASNPFTWAYLVPLAVTGTLLPRRYAWAMGALTVACYSVLMVHHQPLPGGHIGHGSSFEQHVYGMWAGFVLSAGLIAYFISDMAANLRQQDRELAAAREQALRDQRLVALGTLAAGAAHELGTPLGTLALLCDDLRQQYQGTEFDELNSDLTLMRDQVDRCKQALSVISASAGVATARGGRLLAVADYLPALLDRWRRQRPAVRLRYRVEPGPPDARLLADETIAQALVSILDNAADASAEPIEVSAEWDRQRLRIAVRDRGAGLTPAAGRAIGQRPYSSKHDGMGLGLFLAHATLERLGGRVTLNNRDGGGTETQIDLPLGGGAPDE